MLNKKNNRKNEFLKEFDRIYKDGPKVEYRFPEAFIRNKGTAK